MILIIKTWDEAQFIHIVHVLVVANITTVMLLFSFLSQDIYNFQKKQKTFLLM